MMADQEAQAQTQAQPEAPATEAAPVSDQGISKKFMLYSVAFLWSFFIIFLVMYFFTYRSRMKSAQPLNEIASPTSEISETHHATATDSLAADSVIAKAGESVTFDSMNTKPKFVHNSPTSQELMAIEAEVRALINESRKRQLESDELWTEILTREQKQKTARDTVVVLMSDSLDAKAESHASGMVSSNAEDTITVKMAARKELEQSDRKAAIANSAKLYSAMKPKTAASILAQLDDRMVADILSQIKMRQTAKILEAMSVERATKICLIMAGGGRKAE